MVVLFYNVYVNVGFFFGYWVEEEESSLDLESDDEDFIEEGMWKFEGEWRKLKKVWCW